MIYDEAVPTEDRDRIDRALNDIDEHGDEFHKRLSRFILSSRLKIRVAPAKEIRGSGSVGLDGQWTARRAVYSGSLSIFDAAEHVRLSIARETIDTGGQRGIEGTLVHEGKHALDLSMMLSSFSRNAGGRFNPTAFQREYSAHLTSAFYLRLRGGEYSEEGIGLGILMVKDGELSVHPEGIRKRLAANYGLTADSPGRTLDACTYPRLRPSSESWFGLI